MSIKDTVVRLASVATLLSKFASRLITSHQKNKVKAEPDSKHAEKQEAEGDSQNVAPPLKNPLVEPRETSTHANEAHRDTNKPNESSYQETQLRQNKLLVRATIVTAGATAIYMLFAGLQWRAISQQATIMERQLDLAKTQTSIALRSLQVENRTHIGVQNVKLAAPFQSGKENTVQIDYKNMGTTTATDFRTSVWFVIDEDSVAEREILYAEERVEKNLREVQTDGLVIEPGGGHSQLVTLPALNDLKLSLIEQNRAHVYLYVVIVYKDALEILRRVPYCAVSVSGTVNFNPCPFNYITNQQKQQ